MSSSVGTGHFFTDLAISYQSLGPGRQVAAAPLVDALRNRAGLPSVGFLATVADAASTIAVLSATPDGWSATAELGVHLTGTDAGDTIVVDAEVLRAGSRLIVVRVSAYDGGGTDPETLLDEAQARSATQLRQPTVATGLLSFVRMPATASQAATRPAATRARSTASGKPPDASLGQRVGLRIARETIEVDGSDYVRNSMDAITGGVHVVVAEAAAQAARPDLACTGIDLRFVAPARLGPMRGTASAVRIGPRDALLTAMIHEDGDGALVSIGSVALADLRDP